MVGRGRRQEHAVDNVHHAVGRVHICRRDLCAVDEHITSSVDGHTQLLALERRHHLTITQVGCVNCSFDDMIGENGLELTNVLRLEQLAENSRRELGKGFVGGREHGEGSFALER